ncbi:tetratricopeptide repeat protein [Actinoplanes xinjiangensis]|uniref:Tetratricopeptide repeat protein n=1 Tax=Actinoplanes xinjiangensis TaxID=512350 RepID=A0A316F6C0_9ACTN|nr:tetratricopeptide repeat protein [Actinoplanes xinjiangensis]PWK40551.1 tetratricopeptide repeat protein [Actinoplanes xinjiangensis]
MSKADRLIAAITRRIHAYEAGDRGAILAPEMMADAWELLQCSATAPGRYPPQVLLVLAWFRWHRAAQSPPDEREVDLQEAITLFALLPDDDPRAFPEPVRRFLHERRNPAPGDGAEWLDRAVRTADPAVLEQAISRLTAEVAELPQGPARAMPLANLGTALRLRFDRTGDAPHLEAAVQAGRDAVRLIPHDHAGRPFALAMLGESLGLRFKHLGRRPDIDEAIEFARDAVAAAGAGRDRDMSMNVLAKQLRARSERDGLDADLDEALALLRTMAESVTADPHHQAVALSNLGGVLYSRYGLRGDRADLDEAIAVGRRTVEIITDDEPQRARHLSNLANGLSRRFEAFGEPADIDEAIVLSREAVAATDPAQPDRATRLSDLAAMLSVRFDHRKSRADLDESIALSRAALHTGGLERPDRGRQLMHLSIALSKRYHFGDSRGDLDEAIGIGREAAQTLSLDGPQLSHLRANLGTSLISRFTATGNSADIDEAIAVARAAVDGTPAGHPSRATWMSSLARLWQHRFDRYGEAADLEAAVEAARAAVAGTAADAPWRPIYLSALAGVLSARFELAGDAGDLDEAERAARESIAGPRVNPKPQAGVLLGSAAVVLGIRFRHDGDPVCLDEAIMLGRRAVRAGDPADAGRVEHLNNLGILLKQRWTALQRDTDRDEALDSWREAAGLGSARSDIRLVAALSRAHLTAATSGPADAAGAYADAVALLPLAAWRGMARGDREYALGSQRSLRAADAAACSTAAGHLGPAVELVDQARNIGWGQLLDIRTDLSAFQHAAPELAARLDACRIALDEPAAAMTPVPDGATMGTAGLDGAG